MSLFLVSIVLSLLKKIARNIYFSCFFFKYEMWWCYSSSLALHLNQLLLAISIVKNQELYSLFSSCRRLKKRRKKTIRNRYLSECSTNDSDYSVNESNIQSLLSCIWLTFTTSTIHQQIIHIRKDSRILSRILEFQEWDSKRKDSVMIQITW